MDNFLSFQGNALSGFKECMDKNAVDDYDKDADYSKSLGDLSDQMDVFKKLLSKIEEDQKEVKRKASDLESKFKARDTLAPPEDLAKMIRYGSKYLSKDEMRSGKNNQSNNNSSSSAVQSSRNINSSSAPYNQNFQNSSNNISSTPSNSNFQDRNSGSNYGSQNGNFQPRNDGNSNSGNNNLQNAQGNHQYNQNSNLNSNYASNNNGFNGSNMGLNSNNNMNSSFNQGR